MLTGFDAPALHTLYLDRSIKGALLMQTLARVNRTFRGKQDGLLVAYAPLLENLNAALREFTHDVDPTDPSAGRRDVDEAAQLVHSLVGFLREIVTLDWRAIQNSDVRRGFINAVSATTNFLRSPLTDGNTEPEDPQARPLADCLPQPLGEARPRLGPRRRAPTTSRRCCPRCSSTRKCAYGWRSTTRATASPAGNRSPTRCGAYSESCWSTPPRAPAWWTSTRKPGSTSSAWTRSRPTGSRRRRSPRSRSSRSRH